MALMHRYDKVEHSSDYSKIFLVYSVSELVSFDDESDTPPSAVIDRMTFKCVMGPLCSTLQPQLELNVKRKIHLLFNN